MQVQCGKAEAICHEAMSCRRLPEFIGWIVAVSNRLAMTSAGGLTTVAHSLPINQALQSLMDTGALLDAGVKITVAHLRVATCAPPAPLPRMKNAPHAAAYTYNQTRKNTRTFWVCRVERSRHALPVGTWLAP